MNSNLQMADLLVREGASPLVPNSIGKTIYHFSAIMGDAIMLDYAIRLNRHYTLDIQDADGQAPANIAA